MEGYSKQNVLGVTIAVQQDGRIILVKPIKFKTILPSQCDVNSDIDSGIKASEFFSKYSITQLEVVQIYGLLSRWAIAIISRKDSVTLNFDPTNEQSAAINGIFKGKLKAPDLVTLDEQERIKKVENFAREIIRFNFN